MNADLQPTLTGETIVIRPLREQDWPGMFQAASDPLIWELHPASDRYEEPIFRKFFDGALATRSAFAIADKAANTIIGSSRYHGYDAKTREVEIGWTFLARAYWGGKTNAEVKRLMIDHAFSFADTVVFWVGEKNWRSQRAMEKIGGIRRPGRYARIVDNVEVFSVVFEIKKNDDVG